jgi:hypothetical protein
MRKSKGIYPLRKVILKNNGIFNSELDLFNELNNHYSKYIYLFFLLF